MAGLMMRLSFGKRILIREAIALKFGWESQISSFYLPPKYLGGGRFIIAPLINSSGVNWGEQ